MGFLKNTIRMIQNQLVIKTIHANNDVDIYYWFDSKKIIISNTYFF